MDFRKMNRMENAATMRRYLLKEQGYDEDVVKKMSYNELKECYDYYHE